MATKKADNKPLSVDLDHIHKVMEAGLKKEAQEIKKDEALKKPKFGTGDGLIDDFEPFDGMEE